MCMIRSRQRGSQVVEFSFVLLPLCGFVFLILDVAWAIFTLATLQNAVREGVRYAITSQTVTGMGQDNSIRAVVQQYSMGLLSSSNSSLISIQYYKPDTLQLVSGAGSNVGGNLVKVAVNGYSLPPLGPILRNPAALSLNVQAWDRMEGSPGGVPPTR